MKALKNFMNRGSEKRETALDESSRGWKRKAGRAVGPDTYVVGDLCRSIFRAALKMPHRERDELYGGPALLVGAVEARNLSAPGGKSLTPHAYCTITPLDASGAEIKVEKAQTRTIESGAPQWDEVHVIGLGVNLATFHTLRVKVKHYENRWKNPRVGHVDLSFDEIRATADVNAGTHKEGWYDLILNTGDASAAGEHRDSRASSMDDYIPPSASSSALEVEASGGVSDRPQLRLWTLLHTSPPDPQPVAVYVRLVEARSVIAADPTGFSDPYLKLKPMVRRNQGATDGDGKSQQITSRFVEQTLDPVWNEGALLFDSDGPEPSLESISAPAPPTPLFAMHKLACNLKETKYLLFVVKDKDTINDDDLGEVWISFNSLFGDEDAVLSERSLRVDKWFRIRPHKSMDKSLEGTLGHLRLDITLAFEVPLLPRGWQEAVDDVSNETYYHNVSSGESFWEEPEEFASWKAGRRASLDMSAAAASSMRAEIDAALEGVGDAAAVSAAVAPVEDAAAATATSDGSAPLTLRVDAASADADHGESSHAADASAAAAAASSTPPPGTPKRSPPVTPRATTPAAATGTAATAAVATKSAPKPAGDDDDLEDVDDDAVAAAAAALASMDVFGSAGKGKDVIVPSSIDNPLTAADIPRTGDSGDRSRAFFDGLRKGVDEKKRTEEMQRAAKVASMTPEERAEYEAEQKRQERSAARKDRMLQSQMSSYGVKKAIAGGRRGGRGGASAAAASTGRMKRVSNTVMNASSFMRAAGGAEAADGGKVKPTGPGSRSKSGSDSD